MPIITGNVNPWWRFYQYVTQKVKSPKYYFKHTILGCKEAAMTMIQAFIMANRVIRQRKFKKKKQKLKEQRSIRKKAALHVYQPVNIILIEPEATKPEPAEEELEPTLINFDEWVF